MSGLGLRLLAGALALLPLPVLHASAVPLAWLLGRWPWKKHAVVRRNLQACFPEWTEAQRRRLERAQLIELIRLASELGALAHWSGARLQRHLVAVHGWNHVDSALAAGRGVLLVSGHLGNWEILNLELSRRIPMATLYLAPDRPAVDRFITRARSRFGGRMIPSGSAAMRGLLRQLRQGGAIGIAADIQPKQGEGVFAPFFGTPALTMTLVNRLARKTGCAVVFCQAQRMTGGRGWTLHFEPASEAMGGNDPEPALTIMNAWLESRIRRTPEQYLWIYKRFSRRPEGEPRFYPKA